MASVSDLADSHAGFQSTQWGLVLASAGRAESAAAQEALAELCAGYWPPLYAMARRKGRAPADAKDAVQGFLVRMLDGHSLSRADPTRGRFRTYLQAAFQHFLHDEWSRSAALKRGGGQARIELDAEEMESRGLPELATAATPERAFDERWALTVWERALGTLAAQAKARGRWNAFQTVRPFLAEVGVAEAYAAAGESLGMSEGAVKTMVHRLRRELGELLRLEVEKTLENPADLPGEMDHLRSLLTGILP